MVKSHLWQQKLSIVFQMYGLKKHATTSPFLSFCFYNVPRKQLFILTVLPKPDFWTMKTDFAWLLKIQQRDWQLLFRNNNTEVTLKIFYFSLCFKAYKIFKKKIHSNVEKNLPKQDICSGIMNGSSHSLGFWHYSYFLPGQQDFSEVKRNWHFSQTGRNDLRICFFLILICL